MTSTAVVGSTGLVVCSPSLTSPTSTNQSQGSHILTTLLALPKVSSITTFSRREPSVKDAKLHPVADTDSSTWAPKLSSITPPPSIFFSALGTTKAQAGSVAAQRAIDYDLNLSLAQTAKSSGVKVYVLVSSGGANAKSFLAYPKMKGELEEAVKELGFEHTIILRPGLILGERDDSRPAEFLFRKVANGMGILGNVFKDVWAQDAEVIARAAISAGLKAVEGGEKLIELGQSDVVRLGRTEWKA